MSSQLNLAAAQPSDSGVRSGRANAVGRYNQMMPGDWTHLGPGDLERIAGAVRRRVEARSTLVALEGCLMVQAILTTGRRLNQLHGLRVVKVPLKGIILAHLDPGLILRDRKWSWWLPAGRIKAGKTPKPDMMKPLSNNVWLPVSRNTRAVLLRCIKERGVGVHQLDYPLFKTPAATLRLEAQEILSEAIGLSNTRRSATTVASAERWLFRAITHEPGGDPAAAALITQRGHSVAKPMTYYGSLSILRAIELHGQTVKRADEYSHTECPGELARLSIGEARTPADSAVRRLSSQLAERLAKAGGDVVEAHAAMSAYTLALLAFALGLRGIGRVPGHRGIDAGTGFAFVHDKDFDRIDKIRMVWVCEIARKQLHEYEKHLDKLANVVGIQARKELADIRASANDKFPHVELQNRFRLHGGAIKEAVRVWEHAAWPGRPNAGRHWLRGKLSGLCASETLAAFLGHWQSGVQPWSTTSALDPLRYRADLQQAFDGLLQGVGWEVRPSPLCPSESGS